jgi:hypothetical protein
LTILSIVAGILICALVIAQKFFFTELKRIIWDPPILRGGQESWLYFLYDPSAHAYKFGRAVDFWDRYDTHLTSNRDYEIVLVVKETRRFNETIVKRMVGNEEIVPAESKAGKKLIKIIQRTKR